MTLYYTLKVFAYAELSEEAEEKVRQYMEENDCDAYDAAETLQNDLNIIYEDDFDIVEQQLDDVSED